MTVSPQQLYSDWNELRAREKGLHALEISRALRVSECELVASACGQEDPTGSIRLAGDMKRLIARLPELGEVKAVTRNPSAVLEVLGSYGNVEFFGAMGQSVASIDLRIFSGQWVHAFAVREHTRRGVSEGLQFFDAHGRALHKLYLRGSSDRAAYDAIIGDFRSADQSRLQSVEALPPAPLPARDSDIDVAGLRDAWSKMQDTHEFFGMLKRFGVARTRALRLVEGTFTERVSSSTVDRLLAIASERETPFMTFVGNPGVVQIHTGVVRKVVTLGSWLNVLDPGLDVHLLRDDVHEAWIVRKPTVDGDVTSLELYDATGEQISLFVGKRKPGQREDEAWRATLRAAAQADEVATDEARA